MKTKIDLKKVFKEKAFYNIWLLKLTKNEIDCILEIIKEACEQTVDLCAENLREWLESETDDNTSQQTILNTKKQIL